MNDFLSCRQAGRSHSQNTLTEQDTKFETAETETKRLKSTLEWFITNNSIFIPFSGTGRHFETQNRSIPGAGCNNPWSLLCFML